LIQERPKQGKKKERFKARKAFNLSFSGLRNAKALSLLRPAEPRRMSLRAFSLTGSAVRRRRIAQEKTQRQLGVKSQPNYRPQKTLDTFSPL